MFLPTRRQVETCLDTFIAELYALPSTDKYKKLETAVTVFHRKGYNMVRYLDILEELRAEYSQYLELPTQQARGA